MKKFRVTVKRVLQCDEELYCEKQNIDPEDFDSSDLIEEDEYEVEAIDELDAIKKGLTMCQDHDCNRLVEFDGWDDYECTAVSEIICQGFKVLKS
jgi:hypothetical protein